MTSQGALQRTLVAAGGAKYTTVAKLLATASSPTQADLSASPAVSAAPTPTTARTSTQDRDLELLDSLVAETLAARDTDVAGVAPVTGPAARAKESWRQQSDVVAEAPVAVEAPVAAETTSVPETAPSAEMQELTQELQELGKESKEQREQALIKEKQQAINDLAAASTTPVAITDKPVVVLPITAKSKEEAKFKSTKYSIKWLWEWCQKVAKMFAGAVVYKEEVEEA